MPPKKGDVSKKTIQKAAAKKVEDLTFGMKNKKKSKKVQAFVQQVQKQVQSQVQQKMSAKSSDEAKAEAARKAKEQQAAMEKELALLFKSAIKQPKVEAGVDPKSILCEFFKAGVCDKGAKCKFSHDVSVTRKSAKLDLHADRRDGGEGGASGGAGGEPAKDGIDQWDQAKLEQVVKTKHGVAAATKTDIVCKYFLDAIEKELYGWFWVCPNGGNACKYRHALPAGYVFMSKKEREAQAAAKAEEADNAASLEELIEEERAKLEVAKLTPVTKASFMKWKEERAARKAAEVVAKQAEEVKKAGSGKEFRVLSGRALFTFNPDLFVDDAAADAEVYSDNPEDEEEAEERLAGAEADADGAAEGEGEGEEDGEEGASGGAGAGAGRARGGAGGAGVGDESAFLEGDDDDLDGLEDEEEEEEEEEGEEGEEEEGEGDGEEGEGEGEEE